MKKTILFVSHSSISTGGAEDDFDRIISYFSKLDKYNLFILSPNGKRFDSYSKYSKKVGAYNQGWFPILNGRVRNFIKYFFVGLKQIWEIRKFMKGNSFDYAIINVSVLFFPTYFIHLKKIKSITFIRETITPIRIRSLYYKLIRKLSNHFIGVSNFNTDDFRKLSGFNNTSVLYSSIESKSNQIIADEGELLDSIGAKCIKEINNPVNFKLIVNGNICNRKNQILALKVLNHLVNVLNLSTIKLFLVGDIETDVRYSRMLFKYSDQNNLSNNCYFLNAQKKSIIYKLYEKIDLSLITSLSEGMPLVLVESFSFKKPVISTVVGGINEVIKNGVNGFLIEGNDELEIAKKINELRNNNLLYKSLSENCYESFLKNFNLEANMKKLENILNDL